MPVKPTRKVTITLYGSTGADFKDARAAIALVEGEPPCPFWGKG